MVALKGTFEDGKSIGGTAATLLAARAARKFAVIVNASDVAIWISLGGTAAVGTGIYIPAGGSYQIDRDNLWVGAITGIAASGSGKVVGLLEHY